MNDAMSSHILIQRMLVFTAFLAVSCELAHAGDARWWPTQLAPKALVRTVDQSTLPAPVGAYEMLLQSIAGLAAKAVNQGYGDELVWIATRKIDLERWYTLLTKREASWDIRGTFEPWALVDRYAATNIIKGYILYRAEMPAQSTVAGSRDADQSVNVATSLAGVLDGVLIEEQLQAEAERHGLRLLFDARNVSPAECFAAYKDRFNRHILCAQDPKKPNLRDFVIAHHSFVLYGNDKLMADTLGWLEPLSPIVGWNGGDEFETTRLSSIYGHFQTATDWCMNLPVLMAANRSPESANVPHTDPHDIEWSDRRSAVSFVMSDGDNVQWLETNFFFATSSYWNNPDRGKIPLGWSCCFAHLAQTGPTMMEYALRTRSKSDEFIEWGGGYYYPDLFAQSRNDRWNLLARQAARTWHWMQQSNTKIIGFNVSKVDSLDARKSYEVIARETDGLLAIFVFQYAPYEGGAGKTYWVKDRNGIEIPVISARYSIWEHSNHRPRSGTPARVAREIRQSVVSAGDSPRYDWVIAHAWSYFRHVVDGDDEAENMPQDGAAEHGGVRGYAPVMWCVERLPPEIRVIGPEELAWRLRMQHNPAETRHMLRLTPRSPSFDLQPKTD